MSIMNSQGGRRSPKRRKLGHDSEPSDTSSGSSDAEASHGGGDRTKSGHRHHSTTKSHVNRIARSGQVTASKPTVLPTGGINKSATLSLQLSDLSAEMTPDYERIRPKWARISDQLVSVIKGIPQRPPVTATEAAKSCRKQGIQIPWPKPQPTKETNYKFDFLPPKHVVVWGALAQGWSLKNKSLIDVTVLMPNAALQEKDYLNHRALHKAAFYLACIADVIKVQLAAEFHMSFAYMHDVDLLPFLKLVPRDATLSKFAFRISVGLAHGSIPVTKTLPTRNCLRQITPGGATNEDQPTPFYNSTVCYAASISSIDERLRATVKLSPAFAEACRIGQLWLRQRNFSSSVLSGGFGALEWALMCALLLEKGGRQGHPLFSKQYSSLQLFKAMLQVLAVRDLQKDPMLLLGAAEFELADLDVPAFYDGSTGVNILYKMSPWSYKALQHHARVSLATVNSKSQDSFDTTFTLKVAIPLLQYDEVYSIRISAGLVTKGADERQLLHRLHTALVRGLSDRASLVDFRLPPQSSWALNKDSSRGKGDYDLEIGLLTNPDTMSRLVDHGPSADEQEKAAEFRRFWGEKAELRRFKDGSISEALVWSQGAPVTLQIIAYLAMLHFKLPPSSIKTKRPYLDSAILKDDEQSAPISPKDAFLLINSTFQTLTSTLHNLEGLPLPIRSISPASPALRSTSTLHPLLPSTTTPIDIIIQFDSSTRWPDSLPAVQHTKIAFLLKLAELLAESKKELITRVGLENIASATTGHSNVCFLDIIYPAPAPGLSSICFRLRIHHDREAHLLQNALADKSLHGSTRDSLVLALAAHKRDFEAKTAHTLAMKNLITKFPPLCATVRLLKRWISSHLLSTHVPEEVLEIIAAQCFLYPAPWEVPGSATTAFLRCLHFLSRWDWSFSPLIVDLSLSQDGLADAQRAEMETRFQAWRKLDPNMNTVVWFVGSNVDGTGTVWTGNACPPRVVAGRVTALAKAAMTMIEGKWLEDETSWKGLFVGKLADYDFVIHLKSSAVTMGGTGRKKTGSAALEGMDAANGEFKNLQIAQSLDVNSIGHNAVELYLRDLNHAFGSSALFFYDSNGGKVIAGLWRPSVLGRKAWRVRLGWSSVPLPAVAEEDGDEPKDICVFNKEAVVAEMVMLGEGLVKEVKVKE
ncbi:hypothetical protein A1O7_04055 [Cladophialophora yegresii CBS 114405]|uniref:U3 small nucleolar RNA-associated protein 22 n=1 Tax=Cladophialophora yegresii CBS 114405 TaxID=1182544 RepID=W9VW74_9EURO|nr:uncharacterized protein A1O7_04055 [Cladophialophora yegresii CBS 114405]EXJ59908.1 hypothetical protein A1O7_04055 [Cladophialophora yegresii CBS 114405]